MVVVDTDVHWEQYNNGCKSGNGNDKVKYRNISRKGRESGKEYGDPFNPENCGV